MTFLVGGNVNKSPITGLLLQIALLSMATPAHAYIGPGAALGLVGYAVSLGAMVVISLLTVLAWPVMTLLRKRKQATTPEVASESAPAEAQVKEQ